jgi:hypothetical protein
LEQQQQQRRRRLQQPSAAINASKTEAVQTSTTTDNDKLSMLEKSLQSIKVCEWGSE